VEAQGRFLQHEDVVTPQTHPLARFVQHIATTAATLPDAQLLERFVACRDGGAFATLVRRHGSMVLAVCRRVLGEGDWHSAEDVFQATFLVLAHKAGSLRRPQSLGPWLHGVAHRTALKARAVAARRRVCEHEACARRPEACLPPEPVDGDPRILLDDALAQLPDRYRAPLVLCYLQGRTVSQAALELGWPRGTVATRLARGRSRLRRQLIRQGLGLPAAALTVARLERCDAATLPAALARSTATAALQFMDGPGRATATGSVPATVAALTREVLRVMLLSKIRTAALGIVALATIALGLAVLIDAPSSVVAQTAAPPATAPQSESPRPRPEVAKPVQPKLPKGPMPSQALAVVTDGKLLTIQQATIYEPVTVNAGKGQTVTAYQPTQRELGAEHELKSVTAYNTHGEVVDPEKLTKMLAKKTLVLVTQEFDPLHLRVLKEGTLVLVLQVMPAPGGAIMPPSVAVPPPPVMQEEVPPRLLPTR
jgi:RNA polymerase sigma factor (sigma-70 family)